jgi:hypothetical protein
MEAPDGIRLELAPLLSLYGRGRRLSLRVERLPDRARLSRGRNNGDRSWSLMREDLDDLHYLPPEGMKAAHTLAIRIINLDTDDGATLAVLDFPVSPAAPSLSKQGGLASHEAVNEAQLRQLREECVRAKTALEARERELTEARQALESVRAEGVLREESFAATRAAWQSELSDRVASARAEVASKVETGRAAWYSEQTKRIEEARERWQREAEAALTRAKEAWKAEETARLAQAEAQWHEQSAHMVAEATAKTARAEAALARAESEAARMSGDGVALHRMRGELAEANASLVARVRELAEARQSLEQARAEGLRGKAELAAAKAAWQTELDKRLAEVRAETAANRPVHAPEDSVQDRIDQAREQWRQESDAVLSRAKEAWASDEAVRLARAEGRWRELSALSLADSAARLEKAETALARAQAHALHDTTETVELRRAREDLSETRAALADRETRLTQARLEMKRARERWKVEAEIALNKAQEAWKAEEAYRISVARGDWQRNMRVSPDDDDADQEQRSRNVRRLVLDGVLAAALAVFVVVLYPSIAPLFAQYWSGNFPQVAANAGAYVPPKLPPAPPPAAPVRVDVTVRGANVHAEPSATGSIVATLARGIKVTPLEQRGSWVRVHFATDGQTQEGWVYGPYLKDAPGS